MVIVTETMTKTVTRVCTCKISAKLAGKPGSQNALRLGKCRTPHPIRGGYGGGGYRVLLVEASFHGEEFLGIADQTSAPSSWRLINRMATD